jgi:ketosteroid isomerase-like protein
MRTLQFVCCLILLLGSSLSSTAQEAETPKEAQVIVNANSEPTENEIVELRNALVEAFENRDLAGLLENVHPAIVVTWQNAEITRGHEEVKKYYEKMMLGPNSIVTDVKGKPEVDARKIYGDHVISFGHMNDIFTLRGEKEPLAFDSRFSALLERHDGKLKLAGLHLSVNAFDNPIVDHLSSKIASYAILGGFSVFGFGFMIGWLMRGKSA